MSIKGKKIREKADQVGRKRYCTALFTFSKKNIAFIGVGLILIMAVMTGCSADNAKAPQPAESNSSAHPPETDAAPQAPDYAEEANWAYLSVGGNAADLFLICPTVYRNDELLNMPVEDAKQRQRFVGALNMERGIYENSCRMFAPFYRQAALSVYTMEAQEAEPYLELAYSDVRNSFLYYMEHYNEGRPLVLAGFSQGSDMMLRLMKEFLDDKELSERLVAAYLIGWRVTPEDLAAYPHLKMAEGEKDLGAIVSFNTEAEEVKYSIIVPEKTLAINPLNWRTDSAYAPRELNKGACFPNSEGVIESEIPFLTGAYLDSERGTLKVTDISPAEYPPALDIFEEGVYHIYDYQFFYRNLQENVAARLEAYWQSVLTSKAA